MTATGTEFVTLNQLKLFSDTVSSNSTEVDDITIGYTSDNKLQVKDEAVTPEKISDLTELRGEMGLGNTLGALPISCGGTGATTPELARQNLGVLGEVDINVLIKAYLEDIAIIQPYIAEITSQTSRYENNYEQQCIHTFNSGYDSVDKIGNFVIYSTSITFQDKGIYKISAEIWRTASNGFMQSFYFCKNDASPYTESNRIYIHEGYIGGESSTSATSCSYEGMFESGDMIKFYSTMTKRSEHQGSYSGAAYSRFTINAMK